MKPSIAAGAAASLAALALAGCSYVNPITTKENYAASDGSQLIVGEVEALNLIVVTEAEGSPATLIGTLYNGSSEDITVDVTFDGATSTSVDVPSMGSTRLGPDGDATEVSGTAPAAPGLLAETSFVSATEGAYSVEVPVMDATLPEYQSVVDAIG
ncbi:hypothetical protein [Demequina sp. NBRC 110056]|uniref:hypothetical protein n=1 Tax=Demequina sp. NBRC 110056 TaxID=1570345 RepID=UPI000A05AC8E|nr:hypothetical protein [Demequina sp. NBRC 110056]